MIDDNDSEWEAMEPLIPDPPIYISPRTNRQEIQMAQNPPREHLSPITPLTIEGIRAWKWVGNAWSDGPAFKSIHQFVLDDTQSYADRVEALDIMAIYGMGLEPVSRTQTAEEYIKAYLGIVEGTTES